MKKPVPMRSSVACHIGAPSGSLQNPSAQSPANSMQKKHVLTPRPLNTLSVNQPANTVPTTAASSKAMIMSPPLETSIPLCSLRNVGPQSRKPNLTT